MEITRTDKVSKEFTAQLESSIGPVTFVATVDEDLITMGISNPERGSVQITFPQELLAALSAFGNAILAAEASSA